MTGSPTPGLEELRFYDTRTRQVQPFEPLRRPARRHLHAAGRPCTPRRPWATCAASCSPTCCAGCSLAAGYDVTYVTNITDVGHLVSDADEGDDKMEQAAASTGQTAAEIAAFYTEQWATDRRRLGCLEPDLAAPGGIAHRRADRHGRDARGPGPHVRDRRRRVLRRVDVPPLRRVRRPRPRRAGHQRAASSTSRTSATRPTSRCGS